MATYAQYMAGHTRPRKPKPFKLGSVSTQGWTTQRTDPNAYRFTPRGTKTVVNDPHGPGSGHPPKPTQPTTTTPAAPAGPTLSPFEAWYMTNPAYLAAHPNFENARHNLEAQYGLVQNAAGQWVPATGAGSENGIMAQLARALAGQSQGIQDNANSRGLLFSGAQSQLQQNAKADNAKQQFDAVQAFQNALGGINTDESNLISGLYGDYIKEAPPGSPPAQAAAAKKASDDAAAKREADRQARIKKAQDHLRQDRIDAANRRKTKKRRPKQRPGGGMTGGIAGGGA